ncbi:hypothetical protein D479_00565 [Halobacillus sp. BAB-2008]|nr:hypothetical protein D479_00565 [Halobacillus sp. BAB-2008]
MHERRSEPFRYTFQSPLPGFYNKKWNRQVSGPLEVNDISLNGLRFTSALHPDLMMKDELLVTMMIQNRTFIAEGRVIWLQKEEKKMSCGVHVFDYPEPLKQIIHTLGESMSEAIIHHP